MRNFDNIFGDEPEEAEPDKTNVDPENQNASENDLEIAARLARDEYRRSVENVLGPDRAEAWLNDDVDLPESREREPNPIDFAPVDWQAQVIKPKGTVERRRWACSDVR